MNVTLTKRLRFLRAFKSPSFALLWSGQTISSLGNGAFMTALAWQVLTLTHSATAMGIVLFAQGIPVLIFLLVGGIVADRLPRRLVLLFSDSGRAVVVLLIAMLGWTHLLQIWHLVALGLFFGTVSAFFYPAYRSIPPQLVEVEELPSANGLTELSRQMGGLLGPVLGAVLVSLVGPPGAFAFDGLTFVVSALSLLAIRMPSKAETIATEEAKTEPEESAPGETHAGIRSVLTDLREGLMYIRSSTWLMATIIIPAIANVVFSGALTVALPKLIQVVYGAGVWLLGATGTAEAVGAITATFIVGQFRLRRRGIIAFLGPILASLALIAFGLPLPHSIQPTVAIIASVVIGLGLGILQIIWVTLLHELVPNDKLGRVSSIDLLGSLCMVPVGDAASGVLADRFGPAWVFVVGGTLSAVIHIIPFFLRDIRKLD